MKNKQTRIIELRNAIIENPENEMFISGYASVFEQETVLYSCEGVDYKEVISRGAFEGCTFKGCALKYNHNDSALILARTRGGSLKLLADDIGLKFEARLFNTSIARDIYTLLKEGGIDKCSFAFTVKEYSYDEKTHLRRIDKIDKIFDVSLVDLPAYEGTSVNARNLFSSEIEIEKALEREKLAKSLSIRTFL